MMKQAFWFGFDLNDFIFQGVSIHTVGGFIWLCIGLVILTVLFEGLKILQVKAKVQSLLLHKSLSTRISESELFSSNSMLNQQRRFGWFLAEVGIYVVQIISGYIIMLIVMTFNAYLALSVLFGACIGYAVFGAVLMAHRIQNAKLVAPCQHCMNTHRDESPHTTVLEDEGGCCSSTELLQESDEPMVLPPLVPMPSINKTALKDLPTTSVIVHQSCHQANSSHKTEGKSLLTPD